MDLNKFAKKVTDLETGKQEVNIAQVKEVLKVVRTIIKDKTGVDIYAIIRTIK